MDAIKARKLQAQNNYGGRTRFLCNLIVYSLVAVLSTFFYLFWFPSMGHFFSIFLPNICSFCLSPMCLFIVGNIIVLFLVGQSKLRGGGGEEAAEFYDEHLRFLRSPSLGESATGLHEYKKKNEDRTALDIHTSIVRKYMSLDASVCFKDYDENNVKQVETNKRVTEAGAAVFKVDPAEANRGGEVGEEHKPSHFMAEYELNRRAEEFIARVNRQRRLEERQKSWIVGFDEDDNM